MNAPLWQYLLTTGLTFVGSGLAAAIVGAILKRKFDSALEREKNSLAWATSQRTSELAALTDMHERLTRIKSDLASWNLELQHGEVPVELSQKIVAQRNQAQQKFESIRFLLPRDIESAIQQYLAQELWTTKAMLSVQLYNLASGASGSEPSDDFSERHNEMHDLIYGPLQGLIRSIGDHCRQMIHPPPSQ